MHKRLLLFAAALLLVGSLSTCTSNKKFKLAYKFMPGTATPYTLTISQYQVFKADTRPQPQELPLFIASQFNLIVPSKGSQATSGITMRPVFIVTESSKEAAMAAKANAAPILDEKVHFLLDATGTIRNFTTEGEIKERHKPFFSNLEQTMRELFPQLPKQPITKGSSWNSQFVISKQTEGIGLLSLLTKAKYTVADITSTKIGKKKSHMAIINARFEYLFGNKDGSPFEADIHGETHIKIFGKGTGSATMRFNIDAGRMEQVSMQTSISTTTELTRGGKTNTLIQSVDSAVELNIGESKGLKFPPLPQKTKQPQKGKDDK